MFGPQVERLDVKERVVDGDNQEVASDDPGPGLVPERELLRDRGVLIDPRLDLGGAEEELLDRKSVV